MYDLDKILDEVRTKYYASKILPRPNILWSDEHGQPSTANTICIITRSLSAGHLIVKIFLMKP